MTKRVFLLLYATALILLGSCSGDSGKTGNDTLPSPVNTDTLSIPADTSEASTNIPFETKKFERKQGKNILEIEYPVSGNPLLLDKVRSWISISLADTYRGDLNNADAFFRHYAGQLGDDPDLEEVGGYTQDRFTVKYINDLIVTYKYTSYLNEGGPNGEQTTQGITFLQSDGEEFSKKCFTSYQSLHNLMVEGLKQYFNSKTDAELLSHLSGISSVAAIPAPALDPWIDEKGVVFTYTQYEIAPANAGTPHFTLPYSSIKSYLTDRGKAFFID